jgi:hypothetical protein
VRVAITTLPEYLSTPFRVPDGDNDCSVADINLFI